MDRLKKRFPVYSKVIKLYPPKYRREYGQQMLQTTADMLDNTDSKGARVAVWSRIAVDAPANIVKQQVRYSGEIYMKETPQYIKITGIISGLMLLPFIAALVVNGLDKVINNQTLHNSWLWKSPTIGLWALYLPLAAFVLATASYCVYVTKSTKSKQSTWLKRAMDLRRSWPIVIPVIGAFGVLFIVAFHDSAQCWIQTPSHFASHVSQTWQCTVHNQSLAIFKKRV